jgi:hypothetical protein
MLRPRGRLQVLLNGEGGVYSPAVGAGLNTSPSGTSIASPPPHSRLDTDNTRFLNGEQNEYKAQRSACSPALGSLPACGLPGAQQIAEIAPPALSTSA